jgi:hypothetical protein
MTNDTCPQCGKTKKSWYMLCFDCNKKEKQKPLCEVCNKEVIVGHTLCKEHWIEKQEAKKKIQSIDYVKNKKQEEFRDKFEGMYRFSGQKVKSKSELLLLYFFEANDLHPRYEEMISLDGKEYRPDFILDCKDLVTNKDVTIIIEHFGLDDKKYIKKRDFKIKEYNRLAEKENWFFIWTDENDMFNLKERFGKKLNETPLKRIRWK